MGNPKPMIPFEDIDKRLEALGKDRAWLADESDRSPGAIRAALAPNAKPKSRSGLLQKALSAVIEREEANRDSASAITSKIPPGYSAIFLNDAELDQADLASRLTQSPSLAAFCHDVIQAEARRIIAEHASRLRVVPYSAPTPAKTKATEHWLDLHGGIAAGSKITSDIRPEPIPVAKDYGSDCYALQVFGRSAEPLIADGSRIVVRKLAEGTFPKQGKMVVYMDSHGASLKEFGYRKAKSGEEENARLGKVPVLRSLNPEFPDVETIDGGRIDAVYVETL